MKTIIIGTGYVGLVTGTCFAETGIDVVCVDIDKEKIENLKQGIIPIYEPGLEPMVKRNLEKKRLTFSTSIKDNLKDVEAVFIAVGTPPGEDGSADLKHVLECCPGDWQVYGFLPGYCHQKYSSHWNFKESKGNHSGRTGHTWCKH